MPVVRRPLLASTALLVALLLAGCQVPLPREVNRLAIVTVAAFDRTPTGEVRWTVEIPRPSASGVGATSAGRGGGGRDGLPYVLHEGTGVSVSEAERQLVRSVSRELFWAHANYFLVGEGAARAGLEPLLEFASRRFQVRRSGLLFVTRGDAGTMLKRLQLSLDLSLGRALRNMVRANRPQAFREIDVNAFLRQMLEPGVDPFLPVLAPLENGSETIPAPTGMALFREDRLAAFLSDEEGRGVLWMREEMSPLTLTVPCPGLPSRGGAANGYAAVRSRGSSASVRVIPSTAGLRGFVRISAEGDVEEWTCAAPMSSTSLDAASRTVAAQIRREVQAALAAMRRTGLDPVGFGAALHRTDPRHWAAVHADWRAVLTDLPVEVDVRFEIRRTGQTLSPP